MRRWAARGAAFPALTHTVSPFPRAMIANAAVHLFSRTTRFWRVATIARVLALIASVFSPVAAITNLFSNVLPMFSTIARVFLGILEIFAVILTILTLAWMMRRPLRMVGGEPFECSWVAGPKLFQLVLTPFLTTLHQLLVALRVVRFERLKPLFEMSFALLHPLVEPFRVTGPPLLQPFLSMRLNPLSHLLEPLRIALLERAEPLPELRFFCLHRLLERFGVLVFELTQPVDLACAGRRGVFGLVP